jgi:hypothetical protein
MKQKKKEVIVVEVGIARKRLRQWHINTRELKAAVRERIAEAKTEGGNSILSWRHGGMVFTIILSITEALVKVFKMLRRSNKTVPVQHRGIKVRNRKDIGRDPRPCHSFAFA